MLQLPGKEKYTILPLYEIGSKNPFENMMSTFLEMMINFHNANANAPENLYIQ